MGIIKRQSLKTSIVNYFGVLIGVIFMVFIFPHLINADYLGLIILLQNLTYMLVPLPTLGLSFVLLRFYSSWKNSEMTSHFNSFSLLLMAIALTFFAIAFYLLRDLAIDNYKERSPLFIPYYFLVIPLVIIQSYSQYIETYATAKLRVAVPAFLREIVTRILLITLVFLFACDMLTVNQFYYGFVIVYLLAFLILVFYSIRKLHFRASNAQLFVRNKSYHAQLKYAGGMLLLLLFTNVANFVDGIFLSAYLGLGALGIYARPLLLGQMIQVPYRAISLISIPIIREAIVDNNITKVRELNASISINLLFIGCFLFSLLISNVDNIFSLFPAEYVIAKDVLYIIALGRLFDMAFGLNSEILNYSKYYKALVLFSSIMMCITILGNAFLIPHFGLNGAAAAVTISLVIFNLMKTWLIWKKFRFHCFSKHYVTLILLSLSTIGILHFIPTFQFIHHHMFLNSLINIAFKSTIVAILFITPAYLLNISPDFNDFVKLIVTGKILKGGHKMEHL